MNKICILFSGYPGSGKTTFRENLLQYAMSKQREIRPVWSVVSTDDLIEIEAKNRGETYSEAWPKFIAQSEKIAFFHLQRNAVLGDNVIIVDRTNLTVASRKKVMSIVKEADPSYKFIVFFFSCKNLEERLKSRPGKEIPDEALIRMHSSFQVPTTIDEGLTRIEWIDTTHGVDIKKYYELLIGELNVKNAA